MQTLVGSLVVAVYFFLSCVLVCLVVFFLGSIQRFGDRWGFFGGWYMCLVLFRFFLRGFDRVFN